MGKIFVENHAKRFRLVGRLRPISGFFRHGGILPKPQPPSIAVALSLRLFLDISANLRMILAIESQVKPQSGRFRQYSSIANAGEMPAGDTGMALETVAVTTAVAPLTSLPTDLLTPDQIGAQLRVSPITVRDWITVGVTITDPATLNRKRIALKARKVGGRWKVSPGDLEAFVTATTAGSVAAGAEVVDPAATSETPSARKTRVEATHKRLAARLGN